MLLRLRSFLKDFTDNDYILPVGDIVAVAAAAMMASHYNAGRVRILSWDKVARQYLPIQLSLTGE